MMRPNISSLVRLPFGQNCFWISRVRDCQGTVVLRTPDVVVVVNQRFGYAQPDGSPWCAHPQPR